jgi:hypothetical protein
VVKRRALVFVVSDFISAPGWAKPLALLARRHEVIAVRLYDPLEMELPDIGLFVMQDAETGEQLFIDTHDKGFRKRFAELARSRELELREAFRDAGVDALELATDDDLADAILRFADLRKRRNQPPPARRKAARRAAHRRRCDDLPVAEFLGCSPSCRLRRGLFLHPAAQGQGALRYASLTMVRGAMGSGARFGRHVPPLLFLRARRHDRGRRARLPWCGCRRNRIIIPRSTCRAACARRTSSPTA